MNLLKKLLAVTSLAMMVSCNPTQQPSPPEQGLPKVVVDQSNGHFAAQQATIDSLRNSNTVHALVPLTAGVFVDATLTQFSPWKNTQIDSRGPNGTIVHPAPPSTKYFSGTLADDPSAVVYVAVERHNVHGIINTKGKYYQFGPTTPDSTDHVANAINPPTPTNAQMDTVLEAPVPPPVSCNKPGCALLPLPLTADIAIETDNELWAKFGSDAGTLSYIGNLIAADNVIYKRDTQVTLNISYVDLWPASISDPWNGTNTGNSLTELVNYWNNTANGKTAIKRAAVEQISGRSLGGGISYINQLCGLYGYAVCAVNGAFDTIDPSHVWDIVVTSHELGHTFSSPHTHCYSPPIDECYNGESGCYSGTIVCTLMSYCHLCGGTIANIDLTFGGTVSAKIDSGAMNAPCLYATSPGGTTTTTKAPTTTTSVSVTTTSTTPTTTTTTLCKQSGAPCTRRSECCSKRCRPTKRTCR